MTDPELDALLTRAKWDPNRCTVAQALEDVTEVSDEERRERIAAAARDPRVSIESVAKALELRGRRVPEDQGIRRHRNLKCKCPRD